MGSETLFEKRDLKKSKEEPPPTYDSCQKPGPSHDPSAPTEEQFIDEIAGKLRLKTGIRFRVYRLVRSPYY